MKSQTATEYIVLIGVVLVIGTIVVSTLGGIPALGGGANDAQAIAALSTKPLGITAYLVSDYQTTITVRNNNPFIVQLNTIAINGEECLFFYGTTHQLDSGQSEEIICQNVYELDESRVNWPVEINYTDISTNLRYALGGAQDSTIKISGAVAREYMNKLNQNGYVAGNLGCWNFTATSAQNRVCTCFDLNRTRTNASTLSANYTLLNSIDMWRCNNQIGSNSWVSGEGWNPIGNCTSDCVSVGANATFSGSVNGRENIVKLSINRPDASGAGLIGYSVNSNITDLGVICSVLNAHNTTACLIGFDGGSLLSNVYAKSISTADIYVGGITGYSFITSIDKAFAKGSITAENTVGGIAGSATYGVISNSYVSAQITGNVSVGGISGFTYQLSLTNVYVSSKIFGSTNVGGLVGNFQSPGEIASSVWTNYTDDNASACLGDATNPSGCSVR